jgi:hypothetical protein
MVAVIHIAAITESSTSAEYGFDVIAGAAVLLTAGLIVYSIWALASFGFTVLMLACLAAQDNAVSIDTWADAYGEGQGMRAFTRDRIGVLTALGLARERDGQVRLSGGLAAGFAGLVICVARVFAVEIDR